MEKVRFTSFSAAKLNLSLRVTNKRPGGYHDIMSLFLRLPSVETLLISRANADAVRVRGFAVDGENIVSRALRLAREAGLDVPFLDGVPFLDVEITKNVPPGSGMGAGSGNAAAILNWLSAGLDETRMADWKKWQDVALKTGADVPFLFSRHPLALVSGIGEILEPLPPLQKLHISVVFPEWSVGTENAYTQLDAWYDSGYPFTASVARAEANILHGKLLNQEHIGQLPNDFAPMLIDKFPAYLELFDMFSKAGCFAWGITGSGCAAFALSGKELPSLAWPSWVERVLGGME